MVPWRVGHFAKHLGGIQGPPPRGGQGKATGIVSAAGCIQRSTCPGPNTPDRPGKLSCPAPQRWAGATQGACRAVPALCPAVATSRIPPQPAAQDGGPGRNGVVHGHPGHVSAGLNVQPHAHKVATLQVLQVCALQWGDHFVQAVTRIQRRGAGHGGNGLDGHPRLAGAPVLHRSIAPSPARPKAGTRCWRATAHPRHCSGGQQAGWARACTWAAAAGAARPVAAAFANPGCACVALSMAVVSPLTGSRS